MTEILNFRYELGEKLDESYSMYDSQEFNLYNGYDQLLQQDVYIKTFKLPQNIVAKRVATRFWEREIRLTRKVMALKNGDIFVHLLDAFVESQKECLTTIYKSHGKPIAQWVNDSGSLWFLNDVQQKEARREIWQLILTLVNGIESLHQAKIIHRNLNPNTIFYSDTPGETDFKIGGFTWSLYLNNLNYIAEQKEFRTQQYSIFTPLEVYDKGNNATEKINPFLMDIFAIGMIICFLLWDGFPEKKPRNVIEWNQIYNDIISNLENQMDFLVPDELHLITQCIDKNPNKRIKSLSEIRNSIKKILVQFKDESIDINQKLKISWLNSPESHFIKDLSTDFTYNINEILQNPDSWLDVEFKDALIFATGLPDYPLVIQNINGVIFGLKPIFLKREGTKNEDLAEIFVINRRQRKGVIQQLQSRDPIAKALCGLIFTSKFWERDVLSKWKRIHFRAREEMQKVEREKNEETEFQDRLSIMLEAENRIDAEKILKYVVLEEPKQVRETEEATIIVRKDFEREIIGKEKKTLLDSLLDYKNQNGGIIELSESNNPSSPWNHYNEWKIRKIDRKKFTLVIERERLKKNSQLLHEGVLRPFAMNPSLSLYRRKKFAIEDIIENKLLISTILHSKLNTFYLGIDLAIENNTILNILNTIPMFLVQGPPGTGKTWVASTVVSELLKLDPYMRILISCKDHEPLDDLVNAVVEKIPKDLSPKPIIIRTLSPEREKEYSASDKILEFSKNSQAQKILSDSCTICKKQKLLPREMQKDWLNELQINSVNPSLQWGDEILKVANVVFTTSTSSAVEWLGKNSIPYDYVVIEEAAKAYPLELFLPLNLGQRWLLIGDQNQLPPFMYEKMKATIIQIIDESETLDEKDVIELREKAVREIKFFEKLYDDFKTSPVLYSKNQYFPCSQLNSQWRMPPKISEMIATIFYNTQFEMRQENPKDSDPFVNPEFLIKNQLVWVNCPSCEKDPEFEETRLPNGSIYNDGEIKYIGQFLESLQLNDEISKEKCDMVLITGYSAQKDRLKNFLASYSSENIESQRLIDECYTVDSCQGKQADIVIISLVRNNSAREIRNALGFLTASERLNVMFSRVKKRMVIFGCSELISKFQNHEEGKAINKIYEYISKNGIIIPFK